MACLIFNFSEHLKKFPFQVQIPVFSVKKEEPGDQEILSEVVRVHFDK